MPELNAQQFFHGSMSTLKPGDTIYPARELGRRKVRQFSGLTAQYADLNNVSDMALEDGTRVPRNAVTYLTTDHGEATDWGGRAMMKASPEDFNQHHDEGRAHVNVYRVQPVNPRRPSADDRHSDTEWVADRATVVSVHSQSPIDRYCRNGECGDYLEAHDTHCPSCGTAW